MEISPWYDRLRLRLRRSRWQVVAQRRSRPVRVAGGHRGKEKMEIAHLIWMAQPSIRQTVKRPYGRLCDRKFKLAYTRTKVNLRSTFLYTGSQMILTCSQEATVTAPKIEHDIHALSVGSHKLPTSFVFKKKQTQATGNACIKTEHHESGICESVIWHLKQESGICESGIWK